MKESYIETRAGQYTKSLGFLFIKMSPLFFKGIPDRVILGPGRLIFFVEFKTTKSRDSKSHKKRQDFVANLLRDFGFSVYKIDALSEFKRVLKKELLG